MMTPRQIIGLVGLVALSAGAVWLLGVVSEREALRGDVARQARALAALEAQVEQSRLAREVEAARAAMWRRRSADLTAAIEQIGDIPDAPLDPALIDLLDGLRP